MRSHGFASPRFVLLLVLGVTAACGDDDGAPPTIDAETFLDGAVPDAPVIDAGVPDAAVPDAAPPLNGLFAHLGGTLYAVDPTTAALTPVGATGQEWIVLAWDAEANVARAIVRPYSPVGGAASPTLATIDLCTGAITEGPAITLNGNQVRRAEGLVRDPVSGVFSITYGTAGTSTPTEFLSESNGTVDVATGVVTARGNHDTVQDDGDGLFFDGTTLMLIDIASASSAGFLYSINQTTGAATQVASTGPKLLRVAYDPTRDVFFAAFGETNATGRGVATLDVATGAYTQIGDLVPSGTATGLQFNGLLSAPLPVCPE